MSSSGSAPPRFCIRPPFAPSWRTRADDADRLVIAIGVHHDEQSPLLGLTECDPPLFLYRVQRVRSRAGKRVSEDGAGFVEAHTVLANVRLRFSRIPLEPEAHA